MRPFLLQMKSILQDDILTYVVQINGKLRARLDLPKDQSKEMILEMAGNIPMYPVIWKGNQSVKSFLFRISS